MTSTFTGQLILGTDKRNPLFTVYIQEEDEEDQLHVYYGLELLEVVSADRNQPSFKMLVGRLCNAGVSLRVLGQTFQSDPKTIQRWIHSGVISNVALTRHVRIDRYELDQLIEKNKAIRLAAAKKTIEQLERKPDSL